MNPGSLKVVELKAELTKRKISFKSTARKPDLVAALEAAVAVEAAASGGGQGESSASGAGKKRKKSDTGTNENATASSSKLKSPSKKMRAASPVPPPRPAIPAGVLLRVKAHLDPLDLRTHLALSGANKHVRATCYPDDQAWKILAVGAGYGKPTTGVQATGKAGTGWKDVVRALVKCRGYGVDLEDGWQTVRDSIRMLKDQNALTAEAVVEGEIILESNPLFRLIGVSSTWSSLACAAISSDDKLNGTALSALPSVGYAFATCPPVQVLGVEQGFSYVKNPNGVTILDVFTAHLQKAQERVYEDSLLTKFVRDQALKTREQSAWSYMQRAEYEEWVLGTGVRRNGWTTRKALMVEPNESFNGDVAQASPGCILLQFGFDGLPANGDGYSDDDSEEEY